MDWNNINTDRDTSGLGPIEYDQSKVPSLIRKHADNVRGKSYGQQVREAQARNAEYAGLIASEAVDISNETKGRQDTVETQFNSVQQELTDKDVISAPEIIAARGGEATLSERLDKEKNEVTTKLAQIAINVKDFGAKGDGVTNDTKAFQAATEAINANKGGKLLIPAGVYIVGEQVFAGEFGKGYAYKGFPVMDFKDAKDVVIVSENATLKTNPDMKYGSFHPVTGEPYYPELPFTDSDYQAQIGTILSLQNIKNFKLSGFLKLRGNIDEVEVGGLWGDLGRQLSAYGYRADNVKNVDVENLESSYHCLDGMMHSYRGFTETDESPVGFYKNVKSEYNGRQGFSWVGGSNLTVINGKFNNTGKVSFSSSPSAGLDIEAEAGIIRNGLFIKCEFADNKGVGMVAYSGDTENVTFLKCEFYGTETHSIWPNKPNFKFIDCVISGEATGNYMTDDDSKKTKFLNCLFTTKKKYKGKRPFGQQLAVLHGRGAIVENTVFETDDPGIRLPVSNKSVTFRNVTMVQDGSIATADIGGTYEGYNKIKMVTGRANFFGSINKGEIETTGDVQSKPPHISQPTKTLQVVNTFNTTNKIEFGHQIPISGPYLKGDVVFNTGPYKGGAIGWVCTASGEPGTWTSMGTVPS